MLPLEPSSPVPCVPLSLPHFPPGSSHDLPALPFFLYSARFFWAGVFVSPTRLPAMLARGSPLPRLPPLSCPPASPHPVRRPLRSPPPPAVIYALHVAHFAPGPHSLHLFSSFLPAVASRLRVARIVFSFFPPPFGTLAALMPGPCHVTLFCLLCRPAPWHVSQSPFHTGILSPPSLTLQSFPSPRSPTLHAYSFELVTLL